MLAWDALCSAWLDTSAFWLQLCKLQVSFFLGQRWEGHCQRLPRAASRWQASAERLVCEPAATGVCGMQHRRCAEACCAAPP